MVDDVISEASIDFMVKEEVDTKLYYERTEEHWDWPGGSSGPTCGIGYDCGYVAHYEAEQDWTGIVSKDMVTEIMRGVGRIGRSAHVFVMEHRTAITLPYDTAIKEFREREVPKWISRVANAVKNFYKLPPDSAGALTSVGYNRGVGGFSSTLRRFREMHEIADEMERANFTAIPDLIASMRRIWPNPDGDLYKRRIAEAQLFAAGLGMDWKLKED